MIILLSVARPEIKDWFSKSWYGVNDNHDYNYYNFNNDIDDNHDYDYYNFDNDVDDNPNENLGGDTGRGKVEAKEG